VLSGERLCIIPAKGASTRLRRKNAAELRGKPLIQYSIEAARASGLFREVHVSTEDAEIQRLAESLGAVVPYVRPEELARDPAGVVEVCLHMLEFLEARGGRFRTLVILLPTSPLRTAEDVAAAVAAYEASGAKVLMSVSEYEHTPFAALRMDGAGLLSPYFPEHSGKKSQQMPRAYRPNGAVTVLDAAEFQARRSYYFYPMASYLMPRERSVDVDDAGDLVLAESILASRGAG
jgi:CMP-N-acetylneuraminic acid synthetase